MSFDCLITGGRVIDGIGSTEQRADVGISDGRIAAIGDLKGSRARRTVEADGRIVCPGFIDMHSHDDFNLPVNPLCAEKTQQGVTLQVTGNCGFSPAPLPIEHVEQFTEFVGFLDSGLAWEWNSFAEYMNRMPPLGLNVAQLVGHVTVRVRAMGVDNRAPRADEMASMKAAVAEAMSAGAFGFSTGLMYVPSTFASTGEVIELARVAAQHGGGYHTHVRDMGREVFEAIDEAIEIGESSGARVQISHMKINNQRLWGRAAELLQRVERARLRGVEVGCDVYPYIAGSGGLKNSLPYWVQEGGIKALLARLRDSVVRERIRVEVLDAMARGEHRISAWENVRIAWSPAHPEFSGLNLREVAAREDRDPVDAYLDMILADRGDTVSIHFMMNEDDVRTFLSHDSMVIGSDGIFRGVGGHADPGSPHPRHFGTFPRVLGHYVREERVFELPEAIRRMTSASADMLRLADRGRLAPGARADVVVFDPDTIADRASWIEPQLRPSGIDVVLVDGVPVVSEGEPTGATPGTMLRRNRQ